MGKVVDPHLKILYERLLWPVPRVRWEAARSIANLVRDGHAGCAGGLLKWISTCRLESEVLIGLSVIDAFQLGNHFRIDDVVRVANAPSIVSDLLLSRNFQEFRDDTSFRYGVSPARPAILPREQEEWFERDRKVAVPQIFSVVLQNMEHRTWQPVVAKWKHEWRWLQATHARPMAVFPSFFASGHRNHVGLFQVGQTELYVSAYLRTLAFALLVGWISRDDAQGAAQLTLQMSRGISDLEAIERPSWTRGLATSESVDSKRIVQGLVDGAADLIRKDELPTAIRVVDVHENGFVELDVSLASGPSGLSQRPAQADSLGDLVSTDRVGDICGAVSLGGADRFTVSRPFLLVQRLFPGEGGRLHQDVLGDIRFAAVPPRPTPWEIECGPREVRLVSHNEVVSRWVHWYSEWRPTHMKELGSLVGSITTGRKQAVSAICSRPGVETAYLVRIRRGRKKDVIGTVAVDSEQWWMTMN